MASGVVVQAVARIGPAGGEALAIGADVSDADAVRGMAEQAMTAFSRVNVLVNNAGLSLGYDVLSMDEATWDLNFAIVLKSVYLCTKALLPQMIERQHGAIVNIASVNGLMGIGEDAYSAAKAGMINLTENLATRYGPLGIRANVICPGTIRTPAWQKRLEREPRVFEQLTKWYPLGRVGEPEDVANAALFLASDEAAWITGAVLPVDGGLMAGHFGMTHNLEVP